MLGYISNSAQPDRRRSKIESPGDGFLVATALHESDSAWAPGEWTAKLDGDRVSGEKVYVTHGAIADRLLVGVQGGDLVWVDAKGEGVTIEDQGGIDRTRPVAKADGGQRELEPLFLR